MPPAQLQNEINAANGRTVDPGRQLEAPKTSNPNRQLPAPEGTGKPSTSPSVTIGRATELPSGQISETGFLNAAEKYLGKGYKEVSPGRYISADGMRQVRFGAHEVSSSALHAHFEAYNVSASQGGRVIENAVVTIVP